MTIERLQDNTAFLYRLYGEYPKTMRDGAVLRAINHYGFGHVRTLAKRRILFVSISKKKNLAHPASSYAELCCLLQN